jgi:hypothetical protein
LSSLPDVRFIFSLSPEFLFFLSPFPEFLPLFQLPPDFLLIFSLVEDEQEATLTALKRREGTEEVGDRNRDGEFASD